ncbi:MAG: DUF3122 domain-containing protein [Synechococcaceae cyanobacterium SM2_3_1]|nr:DUF3122 domain-containing protein [Synechococcaceae cyanobacterium SM2_3_1]
MARQIRLGLIGLLLGLLFWLGGGSLALPVAAVILQQTEAPGQVLYQSRQTLTDRSAQGWQAIAFKRIRSEGESILTLRLVGFPGVTDVQHPHPLALVTSLGQRYQAPDITDQVFGASDPEGNVGQYDLHEILPVLKPEIPLQLFLQASDGTTVVIPIPGRVMREWQKVAARS